MILRHQATLTLVCHSNENYHPYIGLGIQHISMELPIHTIKGLSNNLVETLLNMRMVYDCGGEDRIIEVEGCVCRVWVVEVRRGPKKTSILLYYDHIEDLK